MHTDRLHGEVLIVRLDVNSDTLLHTQRYLHDDVSTAFVLRLGPAACMVQTDGLTDGRTAIHYATS